MLKERKIIDLNIFFMARTKGALNKPKNNGKVFSLKLEKQVDGAAITRDSAQGYIKWGANNNYPDLLLDLYNQSPTHHSCIKFEVQSIVGGGVDYDAMKIDQSQIVPNYQYSWDHLIRSMALDYSVFGSYSIQIILNKDRKTFSYWHIPMDKVRCSPYDDDGQITSYWICNDWSNTGLNEPVEIDAFDMRETNKIEYGKPYLYVFKPYDPTMTFYQSPFYSSGIKAIQSEVEFVNYDLKQSTNGFTPAGAITMPEVETDEEKRAIIRNITNMFTGSDSAGALMINFRNNIEDKGVEFTPFTHSTSNINLYADANQRTINRILCAHQIPSASLVGLPDVGNSGFASDSQKLETAYQLYERLTGNYHRQCVVQTFNQMLEMNGVETQLILKPLRFNDFGDENDKSEPTETTNVSQDISTDNIEEKVEQ